MRKSHLILPWSTSLSLDTFSRSFGNTLLKHFNITVFIAMAPSCLISTSINCAAYWIKCTIYSAHKMLKGWTWSPYSHVQTTSVPESHKQYSSSRTTASTPKTHFPEGRHKPVVHILHSALPRLLTHPPRLCATCVFADQCSLVLWVLPDHFKSMVCLLTCGCSRKLVSD